MKLWFGHCSEHSANLVIIGQFKTEDAAQEAEAMLRQVTEIALEDEKEGLLKAGECPRSFSARMQDFVTSVDRIVLEHPDEPEQLLYDYNVSRDGNQLVVTTNEARIAPFISIMLNNEANIQVYSAHFYPSQYGRPTYQEP